MPRWCVLISGRGSNLGALIDAGIDIRLVLSSDAKAMGLLRARRAGINTGLTPFQTAEGARKPKIDWDKLDRALRAHGITQIFLAGFMKIVPASFISKWRGRILNLHPSLLPNYPGLNSIERAFNERSDMGLTVHEVNEDVDAGRIVCQRRSLKAEELEGYLLGSAEFRIHVDEQRTIKEAAARWEP